MFIHSVTLSHLGPGWLNVRIKIRRKMVPVREQLSSLEWEGNTDAPKVANQVANSASHHYGGRHTQMSKVVF